MTRKKVQWMRLQSDIEVIVAVDGAAAAAVLGYKKFRGCQNEKGLMNKIPRTSYQDGSEVEENDNVNFLITTQLKKPFL